ncbi:MAG: hypothetical protein EOO85_33440, partial [Pedobacter sp.]
MKLKSTLSFAALFGILNLLAVASTSGQQTRGYIAPQDSVPVKRGANESLNQYSKVKSIREVDTRMIGAATYAASKLSDTAAYSQREGILIVDLFKAEDLSYFSNGGIANIVALFEEVNKRLPKGKKLEFITDSTQAFTSATNPLVLSALRAKISSNPASVSAN